MRKLISFMLLVLAGIWFSPNVSYAQRVSCPGLPEWSEEWEAIEAEAFALINAYRAAGATCGDQEFPPMPPLEEHPALVCAARMHSLFMAELGFFDHIGPDGWTPVDRMRWWGYEGGTLGENIAAGFPTPTAVVEGWMSSPGHCRNIMRPDYIDHGLGFYFLEGSEFRQYWTSNFGGGVRVER